MQKRMGALFGALCLLFAVSVAEAGSLAQINQTLGRPEGWQQIVAESAFSLGERTEAGMAGGLPVFSQRFGSYPSVDGSTVAVPMAMEFARQHLGLSDDDLAGFVFFSTTHGAYSNLIGRLPGGSTTIASALVQMDAEHPVDLIIATEPSDEELALALENGVSLAMEPVCHDAFVFITHRDNPVDSLSVEDLRKIYTGQSISWKDFGGPDARIYAYQREANSGSQTAMEKLVMDGRPLDGAEPLWVIQGMGELVRSVGARENRENSLGYTYRYYIDTLYKSDDIKVLAIDGVAPTDANIRSGAYPFSTSYYGVIRAGEEGAAGGLFLEWMLSEEGQRCIAQAGYIPLGEGQ